MAKVYGHFLTQNYRESYGMFAVSGIMFNHESPRRGAEFVTRKVSLGVAKIKLGYERQLRLGNLQREPGLGLRGRLRSGHAADAGPGRALPTSSSVPASRTRWRRWWITAFRAAGLDWRDHVVTDAAFIRPAEVDRLCADPAKARDELGWEPKIGFEELIAMMVDADMELLAAGGSAGEEFATESW